MRTRFLFALIVCTAAPALAADGVNSYKETRFVANKDKYKAAVIEPTMINAWGISIRPAGAGGHFWVTARDKSFEYVGDVAASPDTTLRTLHQDKLKVITLPVGGDDKFATGTVFSGSTEHFKITQQVAGVEPISAPAKFLFASDGGIISAWTERKKADATFDWPAEAIVVIDNSKEGAQFFGLAINHTYDKLYAADFGANPTIRAWGGDFKPLPITFDQPFDDNKNGKVDPGEYAPFNIQLLLTPEGHNHLYVAYAKTQPCPDEEIKKGSCKKGELFVGEEDTSKPGYGRVAEFHQNGQLVNTWNDADKLSAPWGFAYAPKDFGKLSGMLLVTNFGSGLIAAYDPKTREFVDYMRDATGTPIEIDKIWGILFGNGASLGDTNALYYAAGPDDEKDGLFGSLRPAK